MKAWFGKMILKAHIFAINNPNLYNNIEIALLVIAGFLLLYGWII